MKITALWQKLAQLNMYYWITELLYLKYYTNGNNYGGYYKYTVLIRIQLGYRNRKAKTVTLKQDRSFSLKNSDRQFRAAIPIRGDSVISTLFLCYSQNEASTPFQDGWFKPIYVHILASRKEKGG